MVELRADEIFACLERHGVRYVVIGGLAGILHGSPQATFDADICPERSPSNLEKLAAALSRAESMKIKGSDVAVAALEDVIRSKEAAARPKDQRTLPILRQLLAEVRARAGKGEKP